LSYSYNLRRPTVNVVGSGGKSSYDEEIEGDEKKHCPREGSLLVFREDINSLFCRICAWRPPPPPPIPIPPSPLSPQPEEDKEEEQEEPPVEDDGETWTSSDGFITTAKMKLTSQRDEENDQALRFRPIPNSGRRSEQIQKDAERRGIKGWDKDLERILNKPGFNIISTAEEIGEDGKTYNSAEMAAAQRRKRDGRF
jgi:hypothetical protein